MENTHGSSSLASGFRGWLVAGFCGQKASWISTHKEFPYFVIYEHEESKGHPVQPPCPATGERHNDPTLANKFKLANINVIH